MLGSFDKQNEPIGYQEVADAVFQMKNNKTPGLDGISIDFYKVFFKKLGNLMHQVILACYEQRTLYDSALWGMINLIPKAGKDTRFLNNLRPITLPMLITR